MGTGYVIPEFVFGRSNESLNEIRELRVLSCFEWLR